MMMTIVSESSESLEQTTEHSINESSLVVLPKTKSETTKIRVFRSFSHIRAKQQLNGKTLYVLGKIVERSPLFETSIGDFSTSEPR